MALGRIVKLGKTQSVFSQLVDMGCPDLAPITSKIRESQIIYHNQQYVGRRFRGFTGWKKGTKKDRQHQEK
jgi:hypothetical protein